MLRSTVRLKLESDFVLGDVTREFDTPLVISSTTVHGDDSFTAIAHVSQSRDEIVSRLEESDAILDVGPIAEDMLLLRKFTCGATPLIRECNGLLYGLNSAYGTERLFDILTFNREDIQEIVENLGTLGTVTLERIVPVPERPAGLTKRQYELVEKAVDEGYYDWPRKIDAKDMADEAGIAHATLLEHLRKAEKKLIRAALPSRNTDIFDNVTYGSSLPGYETADADGDPAEQLATFQTY